MTRADKRLKVYKKPSAPLEAKRDHDLGKTTKYTENNYSLLTTI